MIDEIVLKAVETQGITTVLLLLMIYLIRDMQQRMEEKMCKMLDAIITQMKNHECLKSDVGGKE